MECDEVDDMRALYTLLLMAALVLMVTPTALSSPDSVLQIQPSSVEAGAGDTISFNVYIIANESVYGVEYNISFDPQVFSVVSLDKGTFMCSDGIETIVLKSVDVGSLDYAESRTGPDGITGEGVLSTFTLKVLGSAPSGEYDLTFNRDGDVTQLVDAEAQAIPVSLLDGTVSVTAAASEDTAGGTETDETQPIGTTIEVAGEEATPEEIVQSGEEAVTQTGAEEQTETPAEEEGQTSSASSTSSSTSSTPGFGAMMGLVGVLMAALFIIRGRER
ncbi:MAG: cohesin domain-containing protein [Methermicoccaceae archaeon]